MNSMDNALNLEAVNKVNNFILSNLTPNQIRQLIEQGLYPLANEQRTDGKWKFISYNPNYSPFDGSPDKIYECTNCGYTTGSKTKHCPMCGSKNQS